MTRNRRGNCVACDTPHGSNARCGICGTPRGEAAEGAAPTASNPVGSGDDAALNTAFVAWVNRELLRRRG